MMHDLIQPMVLVLSLYAAGESIHAALRMDRGDRLCRMAKYGTTVAASLFCIVAALHHCATWNELLLISAIALFLWPAMIYRFRGDYRNRINDR